MPRLPRPVVPFQPLHIVQRGNNKTPCFAGIGDMRYYLELLADSADGRCLIHAYVLMTNHVHLLVTPRYPLAAAAMMQRLGRIYVPYFNRRHGRTGTLWEGRFRSFLIDTERYFLACSRYIEQNPVRVGMVEQAREHRWSSVHCNGFGTPDRLLSPHEIYLSLGETPRERQRAYQALTPDIRIVEHLRAVTRPRPHTPERALMSA